MEDTPDACQDCFLEWCHVEEEVYVEQPLGFETHERESHVCRLKKSLYDLK